MKSGLLFHIAGLLFPARCHGCDRIIQRDVFLCDACLKTAERLENPCTGCGKPEGECDCGKNKFTLNITAPFAYSGSIVSAIYRFKFGGDRNVHAYLAEYMAESVKEKFDGVGFDFVTCVPQTARRKRQRGYNQSALLAKSCAKLLGLPCKEALLKTRNTKDQHKLKAKERAENLKGAFSVNDTSVVSGKTVLLCDDIKTTGATLNECRKTLLKAGAKEVYCVTAAVVTDTASKS
ncbi:MAG: ComF family protein [Clostridia bacterium]|nr:ComF family protein [Clostridia bacterium]